MPDGGKAAIEDTNHGFEKFTSAEYAIYSALWPNAHNLMRRWATIFDTAL
jgi:hypothetical protein